MATLNDLVAAQADCKRLEAEIERLRAALDMIMRDGQRGRGLAVRLADTARAALSHQQSTPAKPVQLHGRDAEVMIEAIKKDLGR